MNGGVHVQGITAGKEDFLGKKEAEIGLHEIAANACRCGTHATEVSGA
jgi:hypothetical protein